MKNITKQIKEAIAVNALWVVSDFYYFLEKLNDKGFETSHWIGEENWATILFNDKLIGFIWQKYPLIFIKEDHADELTVFIDEFKYIILIKSKDLITPEFTLDMDKDLTDRIGSWTDIKGFSAEDLWFHTVTA